MGAGGEQGVPGRAGDWRRVVVPLLPVLMLGVAGLGVVVVREHQRGGRLEATTANIDDIRRSHPLARVYQISTNKGERWECVLDDSRGDWASGPPACTFDRGGKRVDWTADDGEAPLYVQRVRAGPRVQVTLEQVIAEVAAGAAK